LAAVAAALSVAGCATEPFAPRSGSSPLVGSWRSAVWRLQPQGTWQRWFLVTTDSRVQQGFVDWGLYLGQDPTAISARSVLYGRIAIRGDAYVIHPDSEVTEDTFYGPNSRSVQRNFSGWPEDSVRFAIAGGTLFRQYYSYPADAPVITRDTLYRFP
jgi:hypothetical protein